MSRQVEAVAEPSDVPATALKVDNSAESGMFDAQQTYNLFNNDKRMAMRDDSFKVNVVSEGERKLVIEGSDGKPDTYYLNPIRTMRLTAQELKVSFGASSLTFGVPERLPAPRFSVHGTAWLEGGYISVIGEPYNRSRVLNISFAAYSEADVQAREEEGGKFPKLVTVWFSRRDWEIGNQDSWAIECYVSPQLSDAMASGVSSGTVRRLNIGLTLEGIYSDDNWAPPSVGTNWFLRPSRTDNTIEFPDMARGGITTLDIGLGQVDLRAAPDPEDGEDEEEERQPELDQRAIALGALSRNVEQLQATVKTVGWAIAAVLTVLVFKLH
jgi:phosphate:Na+ symporter